MPSPLSILLQMEKQNRSLGQQEVWEGVAITMPGQTQMPWPLSAVGQMLCPYPWIVYEYDITNKTVEKRVWGDGSVSDGLVVQAWDQSSDVPPNIRCGPSCMYRVEMK